MNLTTKIGMGAAALIAACGTAMGGADQITEITYDGYLQQAGAPYDDGTATLHFSLFDAPTDGQVLANAGFTGVPVEVDPRTGYFSADIELNAIAYDANNDLLPVFNGQDRWLEVRVNGERLLPRKKVNPAPIAADVVDSAKVWRKDGSTVWVEQNTGVGIGTSNPTHLLHVNGDARMNSLSVQTVYAQALNASALETEFASTGVLEIRGGSDIAEPFDIEGEATPGMVVSIDPGRIGEMRIADAPYDSRVAGVISGAGGVNPGLTLTQKGTAADGEHPVALSGRVWCWVDADANGAVEAGDLLTTSPTAGHAMKATDAGRAHGAVIGKAMSSLESGRGLVLVLVNLQ